MEKCNKYIKYFVSDFIDGQTRRGTAAWPAAAPPPDIGSGSGAGDQRVVTGNPFRRAIVGTGSLIMRTKTLEMNTPPTLAEACAISNERFRTNLLARHIRMRHQRLRRGRQRKLGNASLLHSAQ
jgi:hypothetical protein